MGPPPMILARDPIYTHPSRLHSFARKTRYPFRVPALRCSFRESLASEGLWFLKSSRRGTSRPGSNLARKRQCREQQRRACRESISFRGARNPNRQDALS